jgi:hypothetical protein
MVEKLEMMRLAFMANNYQEKEAVSGMWSA